MSWLPMLMQPKFVGLLSAHCSPIFLFQACIFFSIFRLGVLGTLGPPLGTPMLQIDSKDETYCDRGQEKADADVHASTWHYCQTVQLNSYIIYSSLLMIQRASCADCWFSKESSIQRRKGRLSLTANSLTLDGRYGGMQVINRWWESESGSQCHNYKWHCFLPSSPTLKAAGSVCACLPIAAAVAVTS